MIRSIGKVAVAFAAGAFLLASAIASPANAASLRRGSSGGSSAQASGGDPPGSFLATYFDTNEPPTIKDTTRVTGVGDNIVRLFNPTFANGTLCAMIYVFDDIQEMGTCCGCPITPNGLINISVKRDLANATYWEINSPNYDNGVIEVLSATPNNPGCQTHPPQGGTGNPIPQPLFSQACNIDPHTGNGCDPSAAYTPISNLSGYITHDQAVSGTTGLTEVALIDEGTADPSELNYLISQCGDNLENGTTVGACNCPSEGPF